MSRGRLPTLRGLSFKCRHLIIVLSKLVALKMQIINKITDNFTHGRYQAGKP